MAAGLLGTLGAVRGAANLPPAVAMQPAPPPTFHKSLFERMGFRLRLSQTTRMIIRQLARRPLRSGLTILGISLSFPILISAMFMLDSMDAIVDVQFNRINRQDITVSLAEPRPESVRRDFSAMPGVLRAEVLRAIPVRIRKGHRIVLEEQACSIAIQPRLHGAQYKARRSRDPRVWYQRHLMKIWTHGSEKNVAFLKEDQAALGFLPWLVILKRKAFG